MIPEFGHFALIIALCLGTLLTVVPMWGAWRNNEKAMALAPGLDWRLTLSALLKANRGTEFLQLHLKIELQMPAFLSG